MGAGSPTSQLSVCKFNNLSVQAHSPVWGTGNKGNACHGAEGNGKAGKVGWGGASTMPVLSGNEVWEGNGVG